MLRDVMAIASKGPAQAAQTSAPRKAKAAPTVMSTSGAVLHLRLAQAVPCANSKHSEAMSHTSGANKTGWTCMLCLHCCKVHSTQDFHILLLQAAVICAGTPVAPSVTPSRQASPQPDLASASREQPAEAGNLPSRAANASAEPDTRPQSSAPAARPPSLPGSMPASVKPKLKVKLGQGPAAGRLLSSPSLCIARVCCRVCHRANSWVYHLFAHAASLYRLIPLREAGTSTTCDLL